MKRRGPSEQIRRVVLCTPPAPGLTGGGTRQTVRGLLPPLGIAQLAAILEKDGVDVLCLDSQVERLTMETAAERIAAMTPDLVGISFMTPFLPEAGQLCAELKAARPDLPIAAGGPHPTAFPAETLDACRAIDFVFPGEADLTFPAFIRAYPDGDWKDVPSLWFRERRGVRRNPPDGSVPDLESLPPPARHLLPVHRYVPEVFDNRRVPATSMTASRGCTWGRCTFCFRTGAFFRPFRANRVPAVVDEIRSLVDEWGIREVVFVDDDLLCHTKWVLEFCEHLSKRNMDVTWSIRGRCGAVRKEALEAAAAAGCRTVEVGFESGVQRLLDLIDKGFTLDDASQLAAWCRELGIDVVGTFMLALPTETPADGRETIRFAIDLDPTFAAFIPTHPFKGTVLYDLALRHGHLLPENGARRMAGTRFVPEAVYIPEAYSGPGEVEKMVREAYVRFYLRPRYVAGRVAAVRSWNDVARLGAGAALFAGLVF